MSKKKSESAEPAEPAEPTAPQQEQTDAAAMEKVVRQGEVSSTPKSVCEAGDAPPHVSRKEGLGKPRGWAKRRP